MGNKLGVGGDSKAEHMCDNMKLLILILLDLQALALKSPVCPSWDLVDPGARLLPVAAYHQTGNLRGTLPEAVPGTCTNGCHVEPPQDTWKYR